jgi:hypothetical protein
LAVCSLLLVGIAFAAPVESPPVKERKLDTRLQKFFAAKEEHARELTKGLGAKVSPDVWSYFEAGRKGKWSEVKLLWRDLSRRSGQYTNGRMDESVRTVVWPALLEAELAFECFSEMDVEFIDAFALEVIDSIPRGSIYFGGTDYGRGLITALCKNHAKADPFYTLTQNALADGTYLEYLRATYGAKLAMLADKDSKKAFDEYVAEAGERLEKGELKPGENVSKDENGRYSVSGQVAVMGINAMLARVIFEANPEHEFYIEESFPLEWMYPHLEPHGLIMKIERDPALVLSDELVRRSEEFWQKQVKRWLGREVTEATKLKEICEFVEKLYAEADLEGFKGDRDFVLADRRNPPQGMFGKLRSAQGALYAWRAKRATGPEEKARMMRAADLAFRQAFALGPWAHEAVFRYADFLKEQKRDEDAQLVLETASMTSPGDKKLRQRARELKSTE